MKYQITPSAEHRAKAEAMALPALLDQVCCPNFALDAVPDREYGAAFFHPATRENLRGRIESFRKACVIPPLVTTDMEAGPGNMITDGTRFPSMLACGRVGDEDLAWKMGKAAALEGREVGFNWSLAPCADLIGEIEDPIVSYRSAGSDPEKVIAITSAYVRGMQEHGMAATAKHFPGDGFSLFDQHLTTSINPLEREEWRLSSGRVFRELIEAGVMSIMPGHISLPAFDDPDSRGLCPPATLSRKLMVELLRGELGFDGLVVSDAINMGGVVNYMNYWDACATFWENGGDCLLFPKMDKRFYEEMERRVESGLLKISTLQSRAARILAMKTQMGLTAGASAPKEAPDRSQHDAWAKDMAVRAVEVVRDRPSTLPLDLPGGARILHLVLTNDLTANQKILSRFTELLKARHAGVVELIDPGPDRLFTEIGEGRWDAVVCSIGNGASYGTNVIRLHGVVARNMMQGWMRLGTPVVFVSHFHPYVHMEYEAAMDTVINTYRSSEHSLGKVVELLFGVPAR
jgi:beta-N-acetylhexosaminidase